MSPRATRLVVSEAYNVCLKPEVESNNFWSRDLCLRLVDAREEWDRRFHAMAGFDPLAVWRVQGLLIDIQQVHQLCGHRRKERFQKICCDAQRLQQIREYLFNARQLRGILRHFE